MQIHVEAKGKSESKAGRRSPRKLSRIVIEPAKNGHTVTAEYKRQGSDGYPMHESEPPSVFSTDQHKEMMAHVGKHLGVKQEAPEPEANGEEE